MEEVYFEEDGIVSLWVGQVPVVPESNFLRDQFGVEYHDPDDQECIAAESQSPILDLISQLSYYESFQASAILAAEQMGIQSALWIMAQYDFAYSLAIAGVQTPTSEPVFIGSFPWHE